MKYCFQLYVGEEQLYNKDHKNVYRLRCLYLKALLFNINVHYGQLEGIVPMT